MKIIICSIILIVGFICGKIDLDKKIIPQYKKAVHSKQAKEIKHKIFME